MNGIRLKQRIIERMPTQVYDRYAICRDNIRIATRYRAVLKNRIQWTQKNEKMRIVFIVQRTEVFNSVRTIFEAAVANENCEVYLLPLPRCNNERKEFSWDTYSKVVDFCKNLNGGTMLDTYDAKKDAYYDLQQIVPDYVFLNVPYAEQYPDAYSLEKLSRIAKVCYVPYAYNMIEKNFRQSFTPARLSYIDFVFAANQLGYKYCRKSMMLTQLIEGRRLFYVGYPRFDLMMREEAMPMRTTVLWLPRWTLNVGSQAGNEQSSFLLFYRNFIDFADRTPEVDFIIRPHPLMFENFKQNGVMTQEEVEALLSEIHESNNVSIDMSPDYLPVLKKADILLADYSSVVVEYYVTGRPIVYFGRRESFSKFDQPMFATFYPVQKWSEAEQYLTELTSGYDSKEASRKKEVSRFLLDNKGNVGAKILDILIHDFQKKS